MMSRWLCVMWFACGVAVAAQAPQAKEMKGYVVSMDETKLVISNVSVGGPGQTFTMPAPKDGGGPTWVAAGSKPPGEQPRMVMRTTDDNTPLQLTEFMFAKGAFKPADFPAGTHVVATYREADRKKTLEKIEAAKTK
jgi:hypothetical protein